MKKISDQLYRNQSLVYKVFLYIATTAGILYLFPKGGQFKYEFQKGKPWQYENLLAPFDFPIHKSDEEITLEKEKVTKTVNPYYNYDAEVEAIVLNDIDNVYSNYFADSVPATVKTKINTTVKDIYKKGVVMSFPENDKGTINLIREGNQVKEANTKNIFQISQLHNFLTNTFKEEPYVSYTDNIYELLFDVLKPNVIKNENFTEKAKEEALSKISYTRGTVDAGKLIIVKGEVVEGDKFNILNSLKKEYESQLWSESSYTYIVIGYVVLIGLTLLMLLMFLKKNRTSIYNNNTKVTFIFLNIVFMVFLTSLSIKYNVLYIYIVPLTILPIIIKAFFDSRTALFVHVLTIMLLGFIVPNSFEYIFIQIIAGIVTIITVSELYKRASLFISVGQITLVYLIAYFAFYIISEGDFNTENLWIFGFFLLNGLITVVSAQSLIYIYEKLFGLDSDVSLLELSDTNSRLLRELSEKAPGTFHHSLQVANLAEAAAIEIGANAMLARVGALYHDIGKMNNPTFFTENQKGSMNPHDELEPKESASIIINHVIDGISMAKKNNLPDRIIDFIRTHHGTSLVYYFYKKQVDTDPENAKEEDFRYPGPIPFSKETAILMMSDSVEAASKSLKNPTYGVIDMFVEKIINKQMDEGQFLNANITFKEIEQIKKILKQKLVNIYHLRIEYPE
ncbi:HD family phosphohydrolase [Neptunitalea lumnitzerae]|uniref:HDIG domain-containing protein n=1 Tax=Neptunitalea lumnitzerae TaxID=2965509 RepID=A0ABQ5ML93_9FLAO|nr:HDIG domain-containing metalloprotein [Neptunitalea sp. Y10]GLB49835.1 HDIG domain-containing protein [Neptunitalea sp. Y10]